ncbi:MAG: hypothetical protein F7B06_01800 [Opitutae bacterium]|nr:hypothetical protein [Opitutae bacterium]MBC9888592.1 hypothetical protein [Opitutae bacterium]
MKTLLAALVTLAVLNPLCCCLTLADLAEAAPASCCAGDPESKTSPEPGHDAARCEHKALKDSVLKPNSTAALPEVPVIAVSDLFKRSTHPEQFHRAPQALERRGAPDPFIKKWVSVQTDCVRRL